MLSAERFRLGRPVGNNQCRYRDPDPQVDLLPSEPAWLPVQSYQRSSSSRQRNCADREATGSFSVEGPVNYFYVVHYELDITFRASNLSTRQATTDTIVIVGVQKGTALTIDLVLGWHRFVMLAGADAGTTPTGGTVKNQPTHVLLIEDNQGGC